MFLRFTRRSAALVLVASVSAAFTGCATSGSLDKVATPVSALKTSSLGGRLHGGNQPVTGAVVSLWAAGAPATGGGYGTGATLVSTTTTLADGSFTFNVAGASPCTTGQFLYVTATGGNTGAGVNQYSAMMAALPTPCGVATASTFIYINEVTTVAAVWSLQQFMTISPSGVIPWQIGAPSTNISGMSNAFAQTAQLVSLNSGISAASNVANTVAAVTYTTTITPDVNRIDTLADILAACVNTAGTSTCTSLFADTTPGTSAAPTDTIQAAYYLATNPGGLTMPAHAAANSPTYLCNQYVTAAGSPFVPALVCGTGTNDWLIGVKWQAVSPTATVGTIYAASIAIDAAGNIWTGAGSGVATGGAIINELNQTGQIVLAPVGAVAIPAYNVNYIATSTPTSLAYAGAASIPLGYARPGGIAIDTNNNAWYDAYGSTSPGALTSGAVTLQTGVLAEVTPAGTVNGYIAPSVNGAIAIDGHNNLYVNAQPLTGEYYLSEIESGTQAPTETGTPYQTIDQGSGRGTGINNDVFVDEGINQNAWALNSKPATCPTVPTAIGIERAYTAEEESNALTGNAAASITATVYAAYYGAPDALGNAWATGCGYLNYLNISASATATVTTLTGTTNGVVAGNGGAGGLDNPAGVAIDGLGNVWVVNRPASGVTGGISEFSTTTSGQNTTYVALSPGGPSTTQVGEFGFQTFGVVGGQAPVIDTSGNIWIESTAGSFLFHMVGAAAPVVTPTALAIKNGTLANRP